MKSSPAGGRCPAGAATAQPQFDNLAAISYNGMERKFYSSKVPIEEPMASRRKNPKPEKKPKKPGNPRSQPKPKPKQSRQPGEPSPDPGPTFQSVAEFFLDSRPEDRASLFFLSPEPEVQPDQAEDRWLGPAAPLAGQSVPATPQQKQKGRGASPRRGQNPKSNARRKTGKRGKADDDGDSGEARGEPPRPWRFR